MTRGLATALAAALVAPLIALPSHPAQAMSESAALAAAKTSGQRVRIAKGTTERTAAFAEPDGRLTFESAAVPQRARLADGSWADIDTGLRRDGDGLRPGVSTADVRFSSGGTGPAVTLVKDGKRLSLSWPGGLPAPAVSADSATYAEVLPGVDLVLRATRTGFTHVIVVKHRAAALNPALRRIRLETGGDARLHRLGDGSLRAIADGVHIATSRAESAVMWDTGRTTPRARGGFQDGSRDGAALPEPALSTADGPGDRARLAKVGMTVDGGGHVVLTPNPAMLTAPDVTFPLYIDPQWDPDDESWAHANSANSHNENSTARVGYSPGQNINYRSFFAFPVTFLLGKHVENAYVKMRLYHSHACTPQPTHMYHSWSGILDTPLTPWASTGLNTYMATTWNHANKAGGCSDSPQGDQDANFGEVNPNGAGNPTTDIVTAHTWHADWPTLTVGFGAGSLEGNYNGWKKFYTEYAKLVVNYSSVPGKPTGLQVAGTACPASGRLTIGTLNPILKAVYPDLDTTQTLSGQFEWLEIPASGTYNDSTPRKPALPPIDRPANTQAETPALTGLQHGKAYAFRVRTTEPDPYFLVSPWSDWCEFTVDTDRPIKPTIDTLIAPSGPGATGRFRFSTTETDITKFRYGWTFPPTLEVTASGTTTKSAEVELTVPAFGGNTLWAYAVDAIPNDGIEASKLVAVSRPAPPVAHWGLESYPGQTTAQALADKQPARGGDTPLTATGLSWHSGARIVGGQTAGVTTATTLESSATTVDTSKSFSVSTWYRRTGAETGHHVAVSQAGGTGAAHSGFVLVYFPPYGTWGFLLLGQNNAANNTWIYALSDATDWMHVTAVYDKPAKKTRLYINGVLAASGDVSTPMWNANGKLQIGQAKLQDNTVWRGSGQVADVRVYDRVLLAADFTGKLASEPDSGGFDEPGIMTPIQTGAWNFEAAVPCFDPQAADTCEAPDSSLWNRKLTLSQGSDIGSGHRGMALQLDGLDFDGVTATSETARTASAALLTTESYTVSAWVYAPASVTTYRAAVSQQQPGVGSAFHMVNTDDNTWAFGHHENQSLPWTYGHADSLAAGTRDVWVHLVGVFDARSRKVKLYVNGVLQETADTSAPWFANGPLVLGSVNWRGLEHGHWRGGIDDVSVYQGAMSDAAVRILHESELI